MSHAKDVVEVYCAKHEPDAAIVAALLTNAGIECRVVGGLLGGAVGEIPAGMASSPGIWVARDQAAAARQLIDSRSNAPADEKTEDEESPFRISTWQCPRCGSEVESHFDMCWNCLHNPRSC